MPIKKSAILLMVLAASSLSLLVFSSGKTLPLSPAPVKSQPVNNCSQFIETGVFSHWDKFSQILFRPAV